MKKLSILLTFLAFATITEPVTRTSRRRKSKSADRLNNIGNRAAQLGVETATAMTRAGLSAAQDEIEKALEKGNLDETTQKHLQSMSDTLGTSIDDALDKLVSATNAIAKAAVDQSTGHHSESEMHAVIQEALGELAVDAGALGANAAENLSGIIGEAIAYQIDKATKNDGGKLARQFGDLASKAIREGSKLGGEALNVVVKDEADFAQEALKAHGRELRTAGSGAAFDLDDEDDLPTAQVAPNQEDDIDDMLNAALLELDVD